MTVPRCPTCGARQLAVCMACRGRKGGAATSPKKRRASRKNWDAAMIAQRKQAAAK